MTHRLYSWTQISGWELGQAAKAGELRVFCPRPDCEHAAAFRGAAPMPAEAKLWTIARRLRCRGCGRRGGQFEIWAVGGLGQVKRG